jgi:hypothetical protein
MSGFGIRRIFKKRAEPDVCAPPACQRQMRKDKFQQSFHLWRLIFWRIAEYLTEVYTVRKRILMNWRFVPTPEIRESLKSATPVL